MNRHSVTLSWSELEQAVIVGGHRRIRRLRKHSARRWGQNDLDNWSEHIEAAAAEMAVAKDLQVYWADSSAPDFHGDVGLGLQVRHTRHVDGRLILHPEDDDDHLFVLVVGAAPVFDIVGCIRAGDGKQGEWWDDPTNGNRPAFFVPQDALEDLHEAVKRLATA